MRQAEVNNQMWASSLGDTIATMPLPDELLEEIQSLQRKPSEWFSIEEIGKRDPGLLATHFIHQSTGERLSIPHRSAEAYRKLDHWAARLLEREVRLIEYRIGGVYVYNSVAPTPRDDAARIAVSPNIFGRLPSISNSKYLPSQDTRKRIGKGLGLSLTKPGKGSLRSYL